MTLARVQISYLDTNARLMLSSPMTNDLRGRVKFPIGGIAHERVERHAGSGATPGPTVIVRM
jgi:hypothetical protein